MKRRGSAFSSLAERERKKTTKRGGKRKKGREASTVKIAEEGRTVLRGQALSLFASRRLGGEERTSKGRKKTKRERRIVEEGARRGGVREEGQGSPRDGDEVPG